MIKASSNPGHPETADGPAGIEPAEADGDISGALARCRAALADARRSETIYRRIVDNASEAILVAQDGRIRFANPRAGDLIGSPLDDQPFADHIHPDDRETVIDRHRRRLEGTDCPAVYTFRLLPDGGRTRWVEIHTVVIDWENRPATLNFITDISDRVRAESELKRYRHHLEELVDRRTAELTAANEQLSREIAERRETQAALLDSEKKYRNILKNIEEGYFEVDLSGNMTFFNRSMCTIAGISASELMGMNHRSYTTPETARRMREVFGQVYRTGNPVRMEDYEIIRKDGTRRILEMSTSLIRNRDGNPTGFRGIARDVTERKRAEAELAYLAYHDALTGLLNRKAFMERLEESIRYARRYGLSRAILFIDLDRFKQVNDTFGHDVGDQLLQEVASRLRVTLRDTDTLFRLGGDELTVLLNNPDSPCPETVADHIIDALSRPYVLGSKTIDFISPSIGISVFPKDGEDVQTLIKNADTAMYRAKARRGCRVSYQPGMVKRY